MKMGLISRWIAKQIDKQLAAYQTELIQTHYQEVDNMYRQIRGTITGITFRC